MSESQLPVKPKKSLLKRIGKVILIVVGSLIALLILIAILIQTPPVQNFARKKIQSYLTNKLHAKFEIRKIYIGFPKKIVLEGIYLEDKQKDTLFYGGRIKVDVSMFKLLRSEVEVNQLEMENLTAKVSRVLPDTAYNFKFILDAFAPTKSQPVNPNDTSAMKMAIRNIRLDRIRIIYKDDVTGNDMVLWLGHFDTDIDTFDLAKMRFNIPDITASGINARIYQKKALVESKSIKQDSLEAASPIPFSLGLGKINLSSIKLDYGNDVSAIYANLDLGTLSVNVEKTDLANNNIALENFSLQQTQADIRMGKKPQAKEVVKQIGQEVKAQEQNNWRFTIGKIRLDNNHFSFTDDNSPKEASGMDFAHLDINDMTFHIDDFLFSMDSISGKVREGRLREQSGFVLNDFHTNFLYANDQAYLHDLLLETPGSKLQRSAELHYASMEALQKDIGSLQVSLDLHDSHIQVKDILAFVPSLKSQPAFSNPSATWRINGEAEGTVANLTINRLQVAGLGQTTIDIRGNIAGLPDAKKLKGSIVINRFHTTKSDLLLVAPKGSVPSTVTLPETVSLRGSISGSAAHARTNLALATNLGNASVKGTVRNADDPSKTGYNLTVQTKDLDLGKILQNDSLFGPVNANIAASGKGFDPKTMIADFEAVFSSVVLQQYNYHDIKIKGSVRDQQASATLNINDPNARLALQAKSNFSGKFPSVALQGVIDSIKLMPLHFTSEPLVLHTKIDGNFPVTDPKRPEGSLLLTHSLIVTKDQRFLLDTVNLNAGHSDSGEFITMKSEALYFALTGKYDLAQMGTVFQEAVQPYFSIANSDSIKKADAYDFRFTAKVINAPLIKAFMPTLKQFDSATVRSHFTSASGWNASVNVPLLIMGTNRIQGFSLNAGTGKSGIGLKMMIEQYGSGSMNLYQTTLNATVANNEINFLAGVNDRDNKIKYRIGGLFKQPEEGVYTVSLKGDSLLLNYAKWTIPQNNVIKLDNGDINISDLVISNRQQQLKINSKGEQRNAPLEITFSQFRIATITAFIKQDTVLADGLINGQVLLNDIAKQPTFTSDLTINNLSFNKDTVGNLALKVNNTTSNVFDAKATITGMGNDLVLNGKYYVKPANQSAVDLNLDIRKINLKSIEGATMGSITGATGYLNGNFAIKGTFDKPNVNGAVNFNKAGFNIAMLNSYFRIDQEKISVTPQGIRFDSFTIKDSAGNNLSLNGNAYTEDFSDYRFDLDLSADNFRAINSTKQNSRLFYGQFYFDSKLHIGGTQAGPVVEGSVKVNEKTDFTVVLPQQDPGVVSREGIVRFVDMDSIKVDTTMRMIATYDSLNTSDITGMDINVNIEIDKKAVFSLIIDEGNGDFVRMQGQGSLTGGIDQSGKVTLVGAYEIEQGSYQLSFNFLQRRFEIQKGSRITWLGEPTRANIAISAIYIANTSPLTLVEDQLDPNLTATRNTYKQKLPFQVSLKLNGELTKPDITFDVLLPEDENYNVDKSIINTVETRLAQLRQEPSELNKQVFSLLLLNRFVSENPFDNGGGGGGVNAGLIARQSVSKILTEQLNSLAANLIQGVDLNFDVVSAEDYTTGSLRNRTDLNVSLSKQLLSDRLKVTVGSNFELEGPQNSNQRSTNLAGNIALDYQLSKDGRYMLRAYRKNEYEGVLEGYIIETGVKFIISIDYNHFRQLFQKKKKAPPTKKTTRTNALTDSLTKEEQ